jgi:hypothetical protein
MITTHDCTNVRAVLLSPGPVEQGKERLAELLRPIVQQLCLLTVTNMESLPATFFENVLVANPSIVVCWHHADPRVAIALARKHHERFCLIGTSFSASEAKSMLLAMNADEATARKLVGTHLATMRLRESAMRNLIRTLRRNEDSYE